MNNNSNSKTRSRNQNCSAVSPMTTRSSQNETERLSIYHAPLSFPADSLLSHLFIDHRLSGTGHAWLPLRGGSQQGLRHESQETASYSARSTRENGSKTASKRKGHNMLERDVVVRSVVDVIEDVLGIIDDSSFDDEKDAQREESWTHRPLSSASSQ